jgi:hypothetical protein
MTHPVYNRQQLEAVKEIIVQAKPEAKIINDDENYEPWVLISDGVVITRGKTYLQVFNSPEAKKFEIINIDNQTCFNSLAVWQEIQTVIEETNVNVNEPAIVVAPPQNKKKGLSITFVCELNDEKLYAVNFNGVLIGFTCHRGSGRRVFLLQPCQQTIRRQSVNCQKLVC